MKPTQRESQKPQAPGHSMVEGGAPHRAEAFVAIQYDDEGKRANSISRPVSNRQEIIQTARRPDRCRSNQISKRRGGKPQESTKQKQKRATRPHTEANQQTKRGQGQARPTTRRPKSQETQQPQKTTETNHRSNRRDFFPSNARWLSPGRLSSRKDNCILKIHRIKAVATSIMTTMCPRKRTE